MRFAVYRPGKIAKVLRDDWRVAHRGPVEGYHISGEGQRDSIAIGFAALA